MASLSTANRCFVHKLHTKQSKRPSLGAPERAGMILSTSVVRLENMDRELIVNMADCSCLRLVRRLLSTAITLVMDAAHMNHKV